ncbi:MAG: flagellar export protein FliJ [Rhodospirillaceae bacterium]|jgi:flagellar protein FliJ|nr:flagellar export protein FliJ [Rhodospirillaceae bacterium]MBT5564565.1 flagellar export protein FliJ [Rhodospirillaceae bacterium]MBT6090900.1 flagellar export protein FliJ [Rhodospirillaceae bacterium]MBT7451043.1 flagellar export protein FliJ [Rhodospirillaceae bacterium]
MAGSDLATLIRLRKFEVEERQRAMAVLLRQEEAVLTGLDSLSNEKAAETAFMEQAGIWEGSTFSAYLERWEVRRSQFMDALDHVRAKIEEARDELSAAYRGLKTFEITQDQREEAEALEDARLEQIELDEMGLELHRRKQNAHVL